MTLPSSIPESISPAGHAVFRCQTDLRDAVAPMAGETGWTRVWAINGNDEILAGSNLGLWLLVPSGG